MQECEEVFVLLGDSGRVSRHFRSIWLLEQLFRPVSSEEVSTNDGSFTILSASRYGGSSALADVPARAQSGPEAAPNDLDSAEGREPLLHIGPGTQVTFFSPRYCLVFMLDVSPSMMTVDCLSGRVLFEELVLSLASCFKRLAQPFRVPGSSRCLQPELFISVLAQQTVAKHQPVQSVLIQGAQLTVDNVDSIITQLEDKVLELENSLAEQAARFHDSSNSPVADQGSGFVTMLKSGLVGLQLLPDGAADSLILVTDSVCGVPDGSATEMLMSQLRNFDITFSCFQLGSEFHAECSFGFVPNVPLLQFIPLATSGTYQANVEKGVLLKKIVPGEMNFYHRSLLGWQCQYNSDDWRQHYSAINIPQSNRFWSELPLVPTTRRRYSENEIKAPLINVVGTRIRQGYQLANILIRKRSEGTSRLDVKLVLPWKDRASISYEVSADYPLTTANSHVDIYIEGSYDFVRDVFGLGTNRQTTASPFRLVVVRRFLQHIKNLRKADQLLVHLLSFSSSPVTYTLSDHVRSGSSVFYLPPNSSLPIPSSGSGSSRASPASSSSSSQASNHSRRDKVAGAAHQFTMFWKPVLSLEISVWHCWFHVHRITTVLLHDSPLRHLHQANLSSGRFAPVQCRQAAGQLITMLRQWSSFVLLEGHSYVRFIDGNGQNSNPPKTFCLVRVAPKTPFMVLRLAFLVGTLPSIQRKMVQELKELLSNLSLSTRQLRPRTVSPVVLRRDRSVLRRSSSRSSLLTTSVPCVKLLSKNYEKVLVRYDKVPSILFTTGVTDCEMGTGLVSSSDSVTHADVKAIKNSTVSPLSWANEDLACHLCHQRWIWSVEDPTVGLVPLKNVATILAALVRLRQQQGFSLAWSNTSTGIVTMICELMVKVPSHSRKTSQMQEGGDDGGDCAGVDQGNDIKLPCLLQYVLFPPLGRQTGVASSNADPASPSVAAHAHAHAHAGGVAASDTSAPNTPTHTVNSSSRANSDGGPLADASADHLRIATEIWVEPQEGQLCDLPDELKHLEGLPFHSVADELLRDDLKVVSLLSTYEDLLLMCEFPNTAVYPESIAQSELLASVRQHKPVALVPHAFDLPSLVASGNVIRMNLSAMLQPEEGVPSFPSSSANNSNLSSPGALLFNLFFSKLHSLNDHRVPLSLATSAELLAKLLKLPSDKSLNSDSKVPGNLCCFVRSRDPSSLYLTILPASLSDAQRLQAFAEGNNAGGSGTGREAGKEELSTQAPSIPVFIVECVQQSLQLQASAKPLSLCLDFTFPNLERPIAEADRKAPGWLFDAFVGGWHKEAAALLASHRELASACMTTQEMFLAAYVQSVYASLQRGLQLSKQDVAWAIGVCDLTVEVPVDVSTFLSAVCSHCRALGSKNKPNRPAVPESAFLDPAPVSALSSLPPTPGLFVSSMEGSSGKAVDRLTQRTIEHALLPSDHSSAMVSDWSQESDLATSDTDHSSSRSLPPLCQTHQTVMQKQFQKGLGSSFTKVECLPNYFYFLANSHATSSKSQTGRKRVVRPKRRHHADGGAADVESVSSGDGNEEEDDYEEHGGLGMRNGGKPPEDTTSTGTKEVADASTKKRQSLTSQGCAAAPSVGGNHLPLSLSSSQQLRELQVGRNPTATVASPRRRTHRRRRHNTLCVDADSSEDSSSSDDGGEEKQCLGGQHKKEMRYAASSNSEVSSAKPISGLLLSPHLKSPSLHSSPGSIMDFEGGSDNETTDDAVKPLFMSLLCSVTSLTSLAASSMPATVPVNPASTAQAANAEDVSSDKQSTRVPINSLPTCYEEIMRLMSQRRSSADSSSQANLADSLRSPHPSLRNTSYGISIDLFCQLSSLIDDDGSASVPGSYLLSLVESRCSSKVADCLQKTPTPTISPVTAIAEHAVASADVFSFPSPRRMSSVQSMARPEGVDLLAVEQSNSIEATKEKLQWMLRDEIVSAAHRHTHFSSRTFEMVTQHIINSRAMAITSAHYWYVPLRFVSDAEDSLQRFIMEFEGLSIPGYELHKVDEFYYLTPALGSIRTYGGGSTRSASVDALPTSCRVLESGNVHQATSTAASLRSIAGQDTGSSALLNTVLPEEVSPPTAAGSAASASGRSWAESSSSVPPTLENRILDKGKVTGGLSTDSSLGRQGSSSSNATMSPPAPSRLSDRSSGHGRFIPFGPIPIASPFFMKSDPNDKTDTMSFGEASVTTDYGRGYQADYYDLSSALSGSDAESDSDHSNSLYQRSPKRHHRKQQMHSSTLKLPGVVAVPDDFIPEFWLILRIFQNRVDFFHHYRNSENLGANSEALLLDIRDKTSSFVQDSEKIVNQWLLLADMFETKLCSPLLVANTSLSSVTGWQTALQSHHVGASAAAAAAADAAEEDDSSDRSPSIIRCSQHFTPGMFECPCQYNLHIPIHPRLAAPTLGQSAVATALQIVHGALAYFAVSNRDKLYVYREHAEGSNSAIFYLRVFESMCQPGRGGSALTSRAPSLANLHIPDMRLRSSTPLLPDLEEAATAAAAAGKMWQSTNRSSSVLSSIQQAQSVIVEVYGIQEPGSDIREKLLRLLEKKLEEATLKSMTDMLHRNDRSTLYPVDVLFLQRPEDSPQKYCRFSLPRLPCDFRHSFMFYLRQHLLQHMIIPRYAESNPGCHFLPFCRPAGRATDVSDSAQDFIFLFNSQWAVGLGCVAVQLIHSSGDALDMNVPGPACTCASHSADLPPLNFSTMLEVTDTKINMTEDVDCIDVSIWERGTIGINTFVQHLHNAIRFALADFIMEHFLLHQPLSIVPDHIHRMAVEARQRADSVESNTAVLADFSASVAMSDCDSANSSMVVIDSADLLPMPVAADTVLASLNDEQLALLADSRCEHGDEQLVASASTGGHITSPPHRFSVAASAGAATACSDEPTMGHSRSSSLCSRMSNSLSISDWYEKAQQGSCGRLHVAYSQHVLDLITAGCKLSSTSFFKMDFVLAARSIPASSLQDLMQLVNECGAGVTSSMYCLVKDRRSSSGDDELASPGVGRTPHYAAYNTSRTPLKQASGEYGGSCMDLSNDTRLPTPPSSYLLLARNYDQWRYWRSKRDTSNLTLSGMKKEITERDPPGQNYKSFDARRSYQPSDNVVHVHDSVRLPRQQFIAMVICGKQVQVHAYNITQDVMTRLKDKLQHVSMWHELRSAFLSSLLAQKMGLFHHTTLASIPTSGQEHFGLQGHFNDMEMIVRDTVAPTKEYVRQQQSRWQRSSATSGAGHLQTYESLFYGSRPSMAMDKKPFASEADPVKRHGVQAQEMFSIQRRASGRHMQLSDLFDAWQRRQSVQAPVNADLLDVLKRSCRLYHYCASQLLFDVTCRKALILSLGSGRDTGQQVDAVAEPREASISPPPTTAQAKSGEAVASSHESWMTSLRSCIVDRYIEYLEAPPLSFTRVIVKSASRVTRALDNSRRRSTDLALSQSGLLSQRARSPFSRPPASQHAAPSSARTPRSYCLQKTTAGGVILIELLCKTSHFVVKLYAVEGCIIQPLAKSNEQISTLFMQECSRMKDFIHVHSFTYDFHLRTAVQYLKKETSLVTQHYDVVDMLADFLALRKQPKFCQNRIMQDEIYIPVPSTATPEQLFTYMLAHAASFRMDVLEPREPITTTLPGCGAQAIPDDRIRTSLLVVDECSLPDSESTVVSKPDPDFHRCLLIMLPETEADVQHISVEAFSGSGGYEMTLRFYLLLSSAKRPFPMLTRSTNISSAYAKGDKFSVRSGREDAYSVDDSRDGGNGEHTFHHTVQQQWLQMGYDTGLSPATPRSPGSEKSGEKMSEMDMFMSSQMKQIGSRLRNIVGRASQECRRDTLWKRMLYGMHDQPRRTGRLSTESGDNFKWEASITAGVSFDEMEELIPKVTCVPLEQIDANLAPLLSVAPSSFAPLTTSLKQCFGESIRVLKTMSGNISHIVIINVEWQDMVILLTLNSTSAQMTCQAMYRRARSMAPPPTIETSDGRQGDADHLHIESVVNILAFSLWAELLSG